MAAIDHPILSPIFSKDFYLSRHSREDTPRVVKSLNNPSISNMLRLPPFPYTPEDADKWYTFLEGEKITDPDTARFRWSIRNVSSGEMIGDSSLVKLENGYRLGYWLGEEYWGRGIMSNAVAEVLEIAKREKVERVIADVKEGNWGSRKVLEKNGFKFCDKHYSLEEKCVL